MSLGVIQRLICDQARSSSLFKGIPLTALSTLCARASEIPNRSKHLSCQSNKGRLQNAISANGGEDSPALSRWVYNECRMIVAHCVKIQSKGVKGRMGKRGKGLENLEQRIP